MRVAILVEDQYQVLEVWYPYLRLREEGITPLFVGTGGKTEYSSKEGYPVQADMSVKQLKAADMDGVIIPGGYAPDILRRYNEVNEFVKNLFQKGKLVAAICHGGWVLVSAGVLTGRKATCFSAIRDDLVNAGAVYLDKEVVVDGNLITSRNPYDLTVFCGESIKFLKKGKGG